MLQPAPILTLFDPHTQYIVVSGVFVLHYNKRCYRGYEKSEYTTLLIGKYLKKIAELEQLLLQEMGYVELTQKHFEGKDRTAQDENIELKVENEQHRTVTERLSKQLDAAELNCKKMIVEPVGARQEEKMRRGNSKLKEKVVAILRYYSRLSKRHPPV